MLVQIPIHAYYISKLSPISLVPKPKNRENKEFTSGDFDRLRFTILTILANVLFLFKKNNFLISFHYICVLNKRNNVIQHRYC